MSETILSALLRANLAGAAAILLVLALRGPVRRRFGAASAYLLWSAVPIVVLAGLLPPLAAADASTPAVVLVATAAQTTIARFERAAA
jgi:beta-lactamase regulating signal transducer with metallopeptidase domain